MENRNYREEERENMNGLKKITDWLFLGLELSILKNLVDTSS